MNTPARPGTIELTHPEPQEKSGPTGSRPIEDYFYHIAVAFFLSVIILPLALGWLYGRFKSYLDIPRIRSAFKYGLPMTGLFLIAAGTVWMWPEGQPDGPAPTAAHADWWNDNWAYRKAVVIDSNQVTADLENFPVLVSFTDSALSGHAQEDGDDFVFINSADGTKLSHEIEKYASSTGELVAWVKIPELSSTQDTTLYLYYGNSNIGNQEDSENVWDDNYVGVWHLPDDASASTSDSSKYNNNGDAVATASSTSSGKMDGAFQFDGDGDYINITSSDSLNESSGTFSAWMKTDSPDKHQNLLSTKTGAWDSASGFWLVYNKDNDYLSFAGAGSTLATSNNFVPNLSWHYYVVVWSGTTATFYRNGVDITNSSAINAIPNESLDWRIGAYPFYSWDGVDGLLDEVRVSKTARSLDWIKTSYNNQNNVAAFLSPQAEETGPGPVGYWTFDEGYGTTARDESGQGNDGTISGASWQDESLCVSGKCLYFDGTDDYVSADNAINPGNEDFSVSLWFKPESFDEENSDLRTLFSQQDGSPGTGRTWIQIDYNNGQLTSYLGGSSNNGGYFLSLNQWVHTVLVHNNSADTLTWYVNGAAYNINSSVGVESAIGNLIIGSHKGLASGRFHGFIDEVKIYPYARTRGEIWADYAAGRAGVKSYAGVSASFGSASDSWMTDGLVGYWKMDESATTSGAFDSSGNGNDGTYYGEASTTAGKFGNGSVFDGNGDSVSLGTGLDISGTVSVSAWIKTGSSAEQRILDKTDNGNGYALGTDNGHALITIGNSTYQINEGDVSVNTDTWRHLCGTFTNGQSKIYVDGELDKVMGISGNMTSAGVQEVVIGVRNGLYYFDGQIDEVRIYNRALSAAEVRKLFEWAPGPVAHWRFDEKGGTTAYDSAASTTWTGGNHGTLTCNGAGCTNPVWTRGKYGGALEFDGLNEWVETPYSASLNVTNNFTVTAWIYPHSLPSDDRNIVSQDDKDFALWTYSNNLYFGVGGGNTTNGGTLTVNSWNHVVGKYNGVNASVYINGNKVDEDAYVGEVDNSGPTSIGAHRDSENEFNGLIDDVRIYNYALTQKQILAVMQGSDPSEASANKAHSAPVLHLSFDEGYGPTAHDKSIHDNHGTIYPGTGGDNTATSAMWSLDGKWGRAMEFDGADDEIIISNSSGLNITDDITISAWIKLAQTGDVDGHHVIVSKNNNANPSTNWDYLFIVRGNGTDIGYLDWYDDVHGSVANSNTAINDTDWHHVGVTRQNNTLTYYLDGKADGTVTVSSSFNNNSYPIFVGSDRYEDGGGDNQMYGLIDEVKIWNYALSPEEIELEYNHGATAILGAPTTPTTATSAYAASREFCVPGSDDYCMPPVLYLDMNEKGGNTVYDRSGNGNDGTLGLLPTQSSSSPVWRGSGKCQIGNCMEFDGVNDYVHIDDNNSLDLTSTFTLSAWVYYIGNTGLNWSIFGKHNAGNSIRDGYILYYNNGTDLRLATGNASSNDWSGDNVTINKNEWTHISATFSSGATEIYVNGINVLSDSLSVTPTAGNNYLLIGDAPTTNYGSTYWDGLIDHVKIYDYARTPAQIAWDFNEGKPIAEWRFDECTGGTIHDSAVSWNGGTANNGTLHLGTSTLGVTATGTCASSSASFWYNGRNGKRSSAGSFDGQDDWLDSNFQDLNTGDNFTFSYWINTTDSNHYSFGIGSYDGTGYIYPGRFNFTSANRLEFGVSDGGNTIFARHTSPNWRDGNWHHLMFVKDGNSHTNLHIFLDSYEVEVTYPFTGTVTSHDITHDFSIGGLNNPDVYPIWFFDGLIDEVKIFNYALTAEQVWTEYNGGAVRFGN